MSTASDFEVYKSLAEKCLELADQAKSDPERKAILEMAATWSKLADDSDPDVQRATYQLPH
jgi:hypothetical protein